MKRLALLLSVLALTVNAEQTQDRSGSSVAGVIDVHTHSDPDSTARAIDVIDLAKLAKARGMRGIVIKDHYQTTASLAYLVRKEVPGLEVFGGITMDRTNGGINPAAVENMAKVTGGYGRIVWMPTFDSEASVPPAQGRGAGDQARPFVSVSRNGELLPAVREVIAIIAKNNLVLATGHSSAAEDLLLIREGEKQGLRQHMIATHAMNPPTRMAIPQMQEAAKAGAFIEFTYLSLIGQRPMFTAADYAKAIRAIGPEWAILSTDLGQPGNPLHPDGMAAFLATMSAQGFSAHELDLMTKDNPAKLLGLAPR